MANILYLGTDFEGTTSLHRAEALRRLGHRVTIADPHVAAGAAVTNRWSHALHYRTGYRLLQTRMLRWMQDTMATHGDADIVWVDSGELLGRACLDLARARGAVTVLYNHDDPTGSRDGRRFASMVAAIPAYDVCAAFRTPNVTEFEALGARAVVQVWRAYDEVQHAPYADPADIPPSLRSDVAFIGTWIRGEGRDRFLVDLLDRGVPVSIWGTRWDRSPNWERLRPHYRGDSLAGRDYVGAIQGARICLGMLSAGNRDLHTTRTMEIPYAGGLFCAQRTSEHVTLFRENDEAVFWNDVDECAARCKALLADDAKRESIRQAGMARIRAAAVGNQDVCGKLVAAALQRRRVAGVTRHANVSGGTTAAAAPEHLEHISP